MEGQSQSITPYTIFTGRTGTDVGDNGKYQDNEELPCSGDLHTYEELRNKLMTSNHFHKLRTLQLANVLIKFCDAWPLLKLDAKEPTFPYNVHECFSPQTSRWRKTPYSHYDAKDYFPVDRGQAFDNKYQVISKLGWGTTSTVWLARDLNRRKWQSERHVALKISTRKPIESQYEEEPEEALYVHISQANPSHSGYNYVRKLFETFPIQSANGKHTCFVYELLREPLSIFRQRCRNGKFTVGLLKGYIRIILQALDYLHSECEIIHTDIKEDNILVTIEDPAVISDYVKAQEANPMYWKKGEDSYIYLSHNNFGQLRSSNLIPKIADFDLAQRYQGEFPMIHPIQPDAYRAPEVILGAGWSYSADIWNLGVLMWNLLEKRDLFDRICDDKSQYSSRAHLAQMIALLGPPPAALLDSAAEGQKWRWEPEVENAQGKLCNKAVDFFGGPFFNDEGEFLYPDLVRGEQKLQDTVLSLTDKDRDEFLDFALKLVRWVPQERKTAKELLDDPWLRIPDHIR